MHTMEGPCLILSAKSEEIYSRVLPGVGLVADEAGAVARSLVISDLMGHDSHRVVRIVKGIVFGNIFLIGDAAGLPTVGMAKESIKLWQAERKQPERSSILNSGKRPPGPFSWGS